MLKFIRKHKFLIQGIILSRNIFPFFVLLCFYQRKQKLFEILRNLYYHSRITKIQKELKNIPISATTPDKQPLNTVWVYWDTGFQNAPEVVRICSNRLKELGDVNIVYLNEKNYGDHVKLPASIAKKYAQGVIPKAHFSDLLRLELLYQHGGIWLDATVFISSMEMPKELKSGEFFLYGLGKPASNGNPIFVSSWAISAPKLHPILEITRFYLIKYWERSKKLNDYFLFHYVICAVLNEYPAYCPHNLGLIDNVKPHAFQLKFRNKYDPVINREILDVTKIHKLTYKYESIISDSFLDIFLRSNGGNLLEEKHGK